MRQGRQGKGRQGLWRQAVTVYYRIQGLLLPGSLPNSLSKLFPLGKSNIHGAKPDQGLKWACLDWLGLGFLDFLVSKLGCCVIWSQWVRGLVPSPFTGFHLFILNQVKLYGGKTEPKRGNGNAGCLTPFLPCLCGVFLALSSSSPSREPEGRRGAQSGLQVCGGLYAGMSQRDQPHLRFLILFMYGNNWQWVSLSLTPFSLPPSSFFPSLSASSFLWNSSLLFTVKLSKNYYDWTGWAPTQLRDSHKSHFNRESCKKCDLEYLLKCVKNSEFCMCLILGMCACMRARAHTHTHTHTYTLNIFFFSESFH